MGAHCGRAISVGLWFLAGCATPERASSIQLPEPSTHPEAASEPAESAKDTPLECSLGDGAQARASGPPIEVHRSQLDPRPIGRLARRALAEVVWSQLPALGRSQLARVAVRAEGLRVDGWASLEHQVFTLSERAQILGENAWLPVGAEVSVQGTRGGLVQISAPTGFASPERVETRVHCETLGKASTNETMPVGPPYAKATRGHFQLHASADGPSLVDLVPRPDQLFVWQGEDRGFVHVSGGPSPWQGVVGGTSFVFDGWVAKDQITRLDQLPGGIDRDSQDGLDTRDQCGDTRAVKGAQFYVGDTVHMEPAGTIDEGTVLMLGSPNGDMFPFTTVNTALEPPARQHFWIRSGAFDDGCPAGKTKVVDPADGCPICR